MVYNGKLNYEILNIKVFLKVLDKLYFSQLDISASLGETFFEVIKVQRKTVTWNKMTSVIESIESVKMTFKGSLKEVISLSWTEVST